MSPPMERNYRSGGCAGKSGRQFHETLGAWQRGKVAGRSRRQRYSHRPPGSVVMYMNQKPSGTCCWQPCLPGKPASALPQPDRLPIAAAASDSVRRRPGQIPDCPAAQTPLALAARCRTTSACRDATRSDAAPVAHPWRARPLGHDRAALPKHRRKAPVPGASAAAGPTWRWWRAGHPPRGPAAHR